MTAENILLDLLNVPSVSGREQAITKHVAALLSGAFRVSRIPVAGGRHNVLAVSGRPHVLLVAHLDTVPGEVPVHVTKTHIYGRGACDNKGSAAAMIAAALAARAAGRTDVGLLFTVGEETCLDGAMAAQRYLTQRRLRPNLVIIGEPTGLRAVTAQRGILVLRLACSGTRAHSSVAERDSATEKLVRVLAHLNATVFPKTSMNIATLTGGIADNVVADRAEASVSFRSSLPDIEKRVRAVVKKSGVTTKITATLRLPPVEHRVPGFKRHEVSYFTEMGFLPNSIVCGPGDIADAHTATERVSRAELRRAVEFYSEQLSS